MPHIQLETKLDELIDLQKTFTKRDRSHAFVLNRYKKDAEALVRYEPSAGYTMLGIIACLEHDLKSMHRHHQLAISCDNNHLTLYNYAASLDKSCLWGAAATYFLQACEACPTDISSLKDALQLLPLGGYFELTAVYSEKWDKIAHPESNPVRDRYEAYLEFTRANKISESEIQEAVQCVGRALSETELICPSYGYQFIVDDEGTLYLSYNFVVPKGLDLFKFENVADAALSSNDKIEDRVRDKIIFSFSGEEYDEVLSTLEAAMDFDEEDLVRPAPEQIDLIRGLIDGVEC